MPGWITALGMAGMLSLPLTRGVCQDDPDGQIAEYARLVAADSASSLANYRLGEAYLRFDNLQSAVGQFTQALRGDRDPVWTQVWSHIQVGRIFDPTGQRDRRLREYARAQETGDQRPSLNGIPIKPGQTISLPVVPRPVLIVHPIQKTDPEYTDEARAAELEGTVVLDGEIDAEGFARNLKVVEPLGLGLDEKAIEAVKQWHFEPVVDQGQPYHAAARITAEFRLSTKQSRWHLIQAQFDTPAGASRPVFSNAEYPIGAGIGPEAMEEGRVVVAMGRLATAKLTFDVDPRGVPVNFRISNASEPVWGSEAAAMVGQWRFTPGMKDGIAISVPCTLELVWGEKQLTSDLERQLHDVFAAR